MSVFKFKFFDIKQADSAMKVGTDAMILGSLINPDDMATALDVGAGTGVLSLMIAQKNIGISIDAVEIDELSNNECRYNFENSKWSNRFSTHQIDFLNFSIDKKYDLIFSNPPYYPTTNLNQNSRVAVAKHECSLPIKTFVKKTASLLELEGCFWVIIPSSEVGRWQHEGVVNDLKISVKVNVKGKSDKESNRCVLCFGKKSTTTIERDLVVRKSDGAYTDEYIDLTAEFHGVDLRESQG